jgi:hypothetical protein
MINKFVPTLAIWTKQNRNKFGGKITTTWASIKAY